MGTIKVTKVSKHVNIIMSLGLIGLNWSNYGANGIINSFSKSDRVYYYQT